LRSHPLPLLLKKDSLHSTIAERAQSGKSNLFIIKENCSIMQNLFFFMTFAGEEHYVSRGSFGQDAMNCCRAIYFDDVTDVGCVDAGKDLSDDRLGRFRARIVAGDDNEVTALASGLAHLRALGAVAISPAAEERKDTAWSTCLLRAGGKLPRHCDEIAQGVVGKCVVKGWPASTG
jgi:hypothetical protein